MGPDLQRWAFNSALWTPTKAQLLKMSSLIQPEEKLRIGRFLFMKDAKSSLIGRLLIRKLVQTKAGVSNDGFKLARDDKGKPVLVPVEGRSFPGLNFNISHQGAWVVLASDSGAAKVGVDVMNVDSPGRISKDVDDYFRLMNRQFADNEWRQIKGLDSPTQLSDYKKMVNFTRFWSLKEAYVKAIGVGIVVNLKTLDFTAKSDLDYGKEGCSKASDSFLKVDGCLEQWWRFEEQFLDEKHIVAVATFRPENGNLGEKSEDDEVPDFTRVSVDFLMDGKALEKEDEEWVDSFLQKKLKT